MPSHHTGTLRDARQAQDYVNHMARPLAFGDTTGFGCPVGCGSLGTQGVVPAEHLDFRRSAARSVRALAKGKGSMCGTRRFGVSPPKHFSASDAPTVKKLPPGRAEGFALDAGLPGDFAHTSFDSVIAAVRSAIAPVLSPYGVDPDCEDIDAVLSAPGLASDVIVAAMDAVSKLDPGSLLPLGSLKGAIAGFGALEVSRSLTPKSVIADGKYPRRIRGRPGKVTYDPLTGSGTSVEYPDGVPGYSTSGVEEFPNPPGCLRPRNRRGSPAAVGLDPDTGVPVSLEYPDGVESYTTSCGTDTAVGTVKSCSSSLVKGTSNCTDDEHDTVCKAVSYLDDHYNDRVPDIAYSGLNYKDTIKDGVAPQVVLRCVHSCVDDLWGGTPDNFATTPAPPDEFTIQVEPPFFNADSLLARAILGGRDFRAGVLLHEFVHTLEFGWEALDLEDYIETTWPGPGDLEISGVDDGCDLGECEETCDRTSGGDPPGEWRAAYLQARFYGIDDCGAQAFACAYARTFCEQFAGEDSASSKVNWYAVKQALSCYKGVVTIAIVAAVIAAILVGVSTGGLGGVLLGVVTGATLLTLLLLLAIVIINTTDVL